MAAGIDEQVFRALNQAGANLGLDLFMVAFTFLGMSYILVLVVVPLWLKGRKTAAIDIILLVVVSDILSETLKLVFERPRPEATLDNVKMLDWGAIASASGYSFPSGHALRAFAVGTYLALALKPPWTRMSAIGVAIMVGVSRLYLGLHWPSDVAAGAAIGGALALVVLTVGRKGRYAVERERLIAWLSRKFHRQD